MADSVLDVVTQLGKGLVIAVGLEDGIVAEPLATTSFADNLAIDDTFELMDLTLLY